MSCGKGKRTEKVAAHELYTGDLFAKTRTFVEKNYDNWLILSALHGALLPETVVDPYDYTLLGKSRKEQEEWSNRVFQYISEHFDAGTNVVIFAGRDYRKYLQPLLENAGYAVEVPLEGLGIGQQKAWLKRRLESC